ncbi:MAG: NADP-specific glutamate dehydrogenase [Eubacterium sp.]|nr:NADP-specific glutamate dehydrogenase [Eubacterium sp.]
MAYVDEVIKEVSEKNSNEPEFIQAVTEVLESLRPVVEADDRYEKNAILERMCEPERIVSFRVPWVDDAGKVQVNRGFRAQFNSAIGPYKGGIRLHPSVNQSIIKFLGFEQTFKNSLTGLPIGGGKGGSDFNPKGKSDGEIMRFCQSFMTELYRYIGPDTDCPAGDIGCGSKEIGYMFGMYKRIVGGYKNGALSGKGIPYGGSLGRNEATGYGAVYFTEELFESIGKMLAGTTFALSGFGNVSWGVAKKLNELGAKVVSISGPDGYIYDKDGISGEKVDYMVEMRGSLRDRCEDYADRFGVEFHAGEKPWGRVKADVYMPCATQNEIGLEDAKRMIEEGTSKLLIEVANMPTKAEAVEELQKTGFMIAPSKAVNAGGVAVSALEMSQNAMKLSWTEEEVDEKLKKIMKNIFNNIDSAAKKYGMDGNLIAGANIAGFLKVAEAMLDEGIF